MDCHHFQLLYENLCNNGFPGLKPFELTWDDFYQEVETSKKLVMAKAGKESFQYRMYELYRKVQEYYYGSEGPPVPGCRPPSINDRKLEPYNGFSMELVAKVFDLACANPPAPELMHNGLPIGAFFCVTENAYPALWGPDRKHLNRLEQQLRGHIVIKNVNLRGKNKFGPSGLGVMVLWSEFSSPEAAAWDAELQAAKVETDAFLEFFCNKIVTKTDTDGAIGIFSIPIHKAYAEWESGLGKSTILSRIRPRIHLRRG
ncbi:hypothetical protein GLAREA_11953 [Glarea lozoyensis ATCC 20868]|uniref:Uncharacterized protein n=1 Tax=Glarea lozoyensis (strain ATCC 20868 / MF5171) TaxID=1116229 RepID=S3DIM1_GLAL2|nr:uncharacterized protein GLAREA_11953 [Glarea lozoyensis ATCC 20868]EPE31871.1 hypothetical protein GLAREA_11953 [Glarea lozoyensis ATCC 20868]